MQNVFFALYGAFPEKESQESTVAPAASDPRRPPTADVSPPQALSVADMRLLTAEELTKMIRKEVPFSEILVLLRSRRAERGGRGRNEEMLEGTAQDFGGTGTTVLEAEAVDGAGASRASAERRNSGAVSNTTGERRGGEQRDRTASAERRNSGAVSNTTGERRGGEQRDRTASAEGSSVGERTARKNSGAVSNTTDERREQLSYKRRRSSEDNHHKNSGQVSGTTKEVFEAAANHDERRATTENNNHNSGGEQSQKIVVVGADYCFILGQVGGIGTPNASVLLIDVIPIVDFAKQHDAWLKAALLARMTVRQNRYVFWDSKIKAGTTQYHGRGGPTWYVVCDQNPMQVRLAPCHRYSVHVPGMCICHGRVCICKNQWRRRHSYTINPLVVVGGRPNRGENPVFLWLFLRPTACRNLCCVRTPRS